MLREMVESGHYKFAESAFDWREAIRMSCEVLEADGTVGDTYQEEIIACVEKYGPYIVIMPEVAMPHSQEGAQGVHKTAIAFMKLEEPVCFDPDDQDMNARLFFTLASCDSEQHMQNMVKLSEVLMNEAVVQALLTAGSPEDLLKIQKQFIDK